MKQGEDTREKILKAALKLFSRHGYEGARMEKIAAEVGINKASIYFHFKGKEEIFDVLFHSIIKKYDAKLDFIFRDVDDMTIRENLVRIYTEYLEYHWNNPEMDFWNSVYYYPPEHMRAEILQITSASASELTGRIENVLSSAEEQKSNRIKHISSTAKSYYYLLTCISISTELMTKDQAIADMSDCFNILWQGFLKS